MWAGHRWILPFVKLIHFLLGPWLLVCQFIEISNQMEVNGHVLKKLYNTLLYEKKIVQSLKRGHLPPFDWKNVSILQEGGFTHIPPTQPVIRVVLLQSEAFV